MYLPVEGHLLNFKETAAGLLLQGFAEYRLYLCLLLSFYKKITFSYGVQLQAVGGSFTCCCCDCQRLQKYLAFLLAPIAIHVNFLSLF